METRSSFILFEKVELGENLRSVVQFRSAILLEKSYIEMAPILKLYMSQMYIKGERKRPFTTASVKGGLKGRWT